MIRILLALLALLSLAAPLTVDALVSSILFGAMLTPLVVLTLVLLGCLLLNGALRGQQVWAAEVIERRMLVRVAADLSTRGIAEIEAEQNMEKFMAEDALKRMEMDMGIVTPETAQPAPAQKELGPAQQN